MRTFDPFADRWWWFPGARIGAESKFEWRDNRVYLRATLPELSDELE